MSEEAKKREKTLAETDCETVRSVCRDLETTRRLAAWMDALVEENLALMEEAAGESSEVNRLRVAHLASQISVYRRIRNASKCALDLAAGKQPFPPLAPESAEGSVL